ncbi:hypothetical protein B0O99DRAFT_591887 [Bisporella sp. PMI_857]|nr:hypothetical protein B0O99DRAFT_591887 [Bisporella sp. PMI_857]
MAQISAFTSSEIHDRTKKCIEGFNECLAHEQLGKHQWLETGLAEFNLWSFGLNASHSGRSSLDYKVRQRPDLQDSITDLLDGLGESLKECLDPELEEHIGVLNPEDNPENPLYFNVFNIKEILKQLTRLHAAIREAGIQLRHHKADTSLKSVLEQNCNGLGEFREDLTATIMAGLEIWDPKKGLPKPWEKINRKLIKRLVDANIRRRNRIFFATEKMRKEKARGREKRAQLVVVDPQVGITEAPRRGESRLKHPKNWRGNQREYQKQENLQWSLRGSYMGSMLA